MIQIKKEKLNHTDEEFEDLKTTINKLLIKISK
ncbi:hypothetical protein SAMN05443292_1043 [Halpernia frigidisoli]|uniref:Uncharacterized protein n=1 Tax=Halpernia frigidisoli TaxID=1125876 RepID=A0A1I3EF33_9FLAO|nr:hypothetical protein SAMN05443292_1043 [Halpernia frigidisoli]